MKEFVAIMRVETGGNPMDLTVNMDEKSRPDLGAVGAGKSMQNRLKRKICPFIMHTD